MNPKQIGIGILVLAIIAIATLQFTKMGSSMTSTQDTNTQTVEQSVSPTTMAMKESSDESSMNMDHAEYKDGEYSATGNYTSPAQVESVDIDITVKDGIVTDAVFTGNAVNPTSTKMQGLFSKGFKEQVVGKPIDEISLTVVNGSSLTPKGFMDALEKVKTEAVQS